MGHCKFYLLEKYLKGECDEESTEFVQDDRCCRMFTLHRITQEVQAVLPEAVNVIDPEGHLGVSYVSLVPVLIEAVKELKAQNEALKVRIETLEGGTE